MRMKLKIPLFLSFAMLAGPGRVLAQKVGTTSFQFLKVMPDARATALGEAYSSVSNASDAVFWNPAALTRVHKLDLAFSRLDWLLDVTHTAFSLAYSMQNLGTLGVQMIVTDVGEIEVTRADALGFIGNTYNPGLTGETISPGAMVLGLSFARELTDKFSFGLTAKYIREDLEVQSQAAIAFDGGIAFRTGYRSLQLAAVIRHFGPNIKYVDKSYPLPQTFTIGISGYLVSPEAFFLLPSQSQTLLFSYDLSQPRDYDQQHHLGFEYALHKLLFLRGGYKFNFDEEGLTLGVGVHLKSFRLDYSYNDVGAFFDSVHRFTFGFQME